MRLYVFAGERTPDLASLTNRRRTDTKPPRLRTHSNAIFKVDMEVPNLLARPDALTSQNFQIPSMQLNTMDFPGD